MKTILHIPDPVAAIGCFGGRLQFFLNQEQTRGWLLAGLLTAPPGNGPPVHIHRDEDELLTVIEGRFAFFADGAWTEGGPGTTAFLPRGMPHAFRNIGDAEGKLQVFANSPNLISFFAKCEEPFHLPDGPDMETITAIAADHGIEFVKESQPQIV